MRYNRAYDIADTLSQLDNLQSNSGYSKLFIVQNTIHNLRRLGIAFDAYRFSKRAGYNFDCSK